jgi:hypothetical protein
MKAAAPEEAWQTAVTLCLTLDLDWTEARYGLYWTELHPKCLQAEKALK